MAESRHRYSGLHRHSMSLVRSSRQYCISSSDCCCADKDVHRRSWSRTRGQVVRPPLGRPPLHCAQPTESFVPIGNDRQRHGIKAKQQSELLFPTAFITHHNNVSRRIRRQRADSSLFVLKTRLEIQQAALCRLPLDGALRLKDFTSLSPA